MPVLRYYVRSWLASVHAIARPSNEARKRSRNATRWSSDSNGKQRAASARSGPNGSQGLPGNYTRELPINPRI